MSKRNDRIQPQAAKLSQPGKLPVLDWDGKRVADTTAIAELLNERQPQPPLYPAGPQDAAMARMFEDWADESLYYYELFFRVQYPAARSKAVALLCGGRPGWESFIFAPIFVRSTRNKLKEHGFLGRLIATPKAARRLPTRKPRP